MQIMKNLKNKRGTALESAMSMLVFSLAIAVVLGVFLYAFGIIDTSLFGSGNIQAGSVNMSNASANTIGKISQGYVGGVDLIGILFLFGMIIAMVINGFVMRDKNPQIFFIIDFLLMLFAYILAVYISNSYETLLNALPFSDTVITNMPKTNRFMLLLPRITVIASAITLIVTYVGIPKTKEEEVAGF